MPATYDSIATSTFTNQNSVSFSNIPNTFTDLRLIYIVRTASANQNLLLRINDVSTNSYAYSSITGQGSGNLVGMTGTSNVNAIVLDNWYGFSSTIPCGYIVDFFSYRASGLSRFMLGKVAQSFGGTNGSVSNVMGYYYQSATVSTISLIGAGSATMSGTATLYGILRA